MRGTSLQEYSNFVRGWVLCEEFHLNIRRWCLPRERLHLTSIFPR
jgi:hypothetical protein